MSEAKHTAFTPGPWSFDGDWHRIPTIFGADGTRVAFVTKDRREATPEREANARLIAAAPELFAACKEFVRKVEAGEAKSKRSYAQMKAALLKAGGRS